MVVLELHEVEPCSEHLSWLPHLGLNLGLTLVGLTLVSSTDSHDGGPASICSRSPSTLPSKWPARLSYKLLRTSHSSSLYRDDSREAD